MAWLFCGDNVSATAAEEEEPALVINNPRLAALIKHGCNAFFLVIFVEHILMMFGAILYCDKWMALAGILFLTPVFAIMLYVIPYLKGEYIEKYAMAPPDANVEANAPTGKV